MGEYFALGPGLRTKHSNVLMSRPRKKYFSFRPGLNQPISISSYDTRSRSFLLVFFSSHLARPYAPSWNFFQPCPPYRAWVGNVLR